MLACQRFKEFSHGAAFAALCLFQAKADVPHTPKKFLILKQLLVSFGTLNHHFRLAVDRQYGWCTNPFELGDTVKFPKCRQRRHPLSPDQNRLNPCPSVAVIFRVSRPRSQPAQTT